MYSNNGGWKFQGIVPNHVIRDTPECQKGLHSNSRIRSRAFSENHFVEATWKRHSFYLFWHFYLHQLKIQSSNHSEKTLVPLNSLKSTTQLEPKRTQKLAVPQNFVPRGWFEVWMVTPNGYYHAFDQLFGRIWPIFGRISTKLNHWSILAALILN